MLLWSLIASTTEREFILDEIIAQESDPYRIANHPALISVDLDGRGTLTANVDSDDFETVAAGRSITETGNYVTDDLNFYREAVSAGLRYRQRETSTHVATTLGDRVGLARTIRAYVNQVDFTRTSDIAVAGGSFTTTYKDASAADPTLEDLLEAFFAHETATLGEAGLAILHPSAVQKLRIDAVFVQSMNNAAMGPEFAALKALYGASYVGRVGRYDIFQSPEVSSSGGKYLNPIFSRGGIVTATATPPAQSADHVVIGGFRLARQADPDTPAGTTRWERFMGSAIAYDAKGGLFKTDVP